MLLPLLRHKSPVAVNIELFKTQSLTNKSTFIHEHILDKRIDIMCLTETWQQPGVYLSLNEACLNGYTYLDKANSAG